MNGPSEHLSWIELACHDSPRTQYPKEWRSDRALELAKAFERVRELCGFPLTVNSAYRTPAYNRSIGGAIKSQHVEGRALDLVPVPCNDKNLMALRVAANAARREGLLRGIGNYTGFVHIDTRPGIEFTWRGSRTAITHNA